MSDQENQIKQIQTVVTETDQLVEPFKQQNSPLNHLSEIELTNLKVNENSANHLISNNDSALYSGTPNYEKKKRKQNASFTQCQPIEIYWENLSIEIKKQTRVRRGFKFIKNVEEKVILKNVKGIARPNTFTAILGPAVAGKTTLLNFLSGRLAGKNIIIHGNVKINGVLTKDIGKYSKVIAYVMQSDILCPLMTPREAFIFAATLRLNLTKKEIADKAEDVINELGLQLCANTIIGNTMIRGVSGGERKRTSIGVELLTNPSLIFLDEPTTGLDSATACNVIDALKELAKKGRTVMATINQPSSNIFNLFDRLMLLVEGQIIYLGDAQSSTEYFRNIGFPCPKFSNPAHYYIKIMNPEGLMIDKLKKQLDEDVDYNIILDKGESLKEEFQERIRLFVSKYQESEDYQDLNNKFQLDKQLTKDQLKDIQKQAQNSTVIQFKQICQREFICQWRNPQEFKMKVLQIIVQGCFAIIVFNHLGTGRRGIQNRNGALFFLIMIVTFASTLGSLDAFVFERPLFDREKANNSYSTTAYFLGKQFIELPLQLIYVTVFTLLTYFVIGLNLESAEKFFIELLILNLVYFSSASQSILLSIFIPQFELAITITPMLLIPQVILSGFLVNVEQIPVFFKEFEYLGSMRFGFQAMFYNEFRGLSAQALKDENLCTMYKDNICDPIKESAFKESMWINILACFILGVGFRFLAWIAFLVISRPKRTRFQV